MTHKELIIEAEKQLKRWRCYPICTEMVCYTSTGETPDAIGWSSNGSILFECKASRLDFLRDKDKPFRKVNESGMGDFRFYLTNKDVIKSVEEMPKGWGCYEIIDGKVKYQIDSVNCSDDANILELSKKDDSLEVYSKGHTVGELFRAWDETYDKALYGDVLFSNKTQAYNIGIKPLTIKDLVDFEENNKIVNNATKKNISTLFTYKVSIFFTTDFPFF